mgnify:FL=1
MKTPLKIIAPAAAILAIVAAVPASAGNNTGATYTTSAVQYSDLDLTTQDGQETLQKRVNKAVSKVCGFAGRVTLREQMASKACTKAASRQADQETRTVIARANNGERLAATLSPVVAGN